MIVVCILLIILQLSSTQALKCYDAGEAATCEKEKTEGLCWTFPVVRRCQKTCDFCNKGWTSWSQWGDCSANDCGRTGERVRVRRCRSIYKNVYCPGSEVDVKKCTRSNCESADIECGSGSFSCIRANSSSLQTCWPSQWICDGYADCVGDDDEVDCTTSGGPNNSFYIATKSKDNYCIRVHKTKGLSVTWGCPNVNSPTANSYRWKWHLAHHLRNIETGECLQADPKKLSATAAECADNDTMQQWTCGNNSNSVALIDLNSTNRYLSVDAPHFRPSVSSSPTFEWRIPESPDIICERKPRWSGWGNWTECQPDCVELGKGLKYRYRHCVNDFDGHGVCVGNTTDSKLCENRLCLPQCPEDFHEPLYPYACIKLIKDVPLTLAEAHKACKNITVQGVPVRGKLVAIKTLRTHAMVLALIQENQTSKAYIGVDIHVENGRFLPFNYSTDSQPVGDLIQGSMWYDVTVGELAKGWEGDEGTKYKLRLNGGDCLDVSEKKDFEAVLSPCSSDDVFWRMVDRILIHVRTKTCLSWKYTPTNSSGTPKTGGIRTQVGGTECSIKDEGIKWEVDDEHITSAGDGMQLSVDEGSLVFRDPHNNEWMAMSTFSGLRSVPTTRDEDGDWYQFMFGDLCLSTATTHEVTLKGCNAEDTRQRWSIISKKQILHRDTGRCLSLEAEAVVANDSTVVTSVCSDEEALQNWKIRQQATLGIVRIASYENGKLLLLPMCGATSTGDIRVCIGESKIYPGKWKQEKLEPKPRSESLVLVSASSESQEECLQPKDLKCSDSALVYKKCWTAKKEGLWRWHEEGRMLINIPSSSKQNCCLSATSTENTGPAVMNPCDAASSLQLWAVIKGKKGSRIGLAAKSSFVLYNNVMEGQKNKESPVIVRDQAAGTWAAISENGIEVTLPVIYNCKSAGNDADDIMHKHTESGKLCQSWDSQFPHKHTYPSEPHNYCRNPQSYRMDSHPPWCLTADLELRWESCMVPPCPLTLGVLVADQVIAWQITGGVEKLPYVCEAPVECVNGIGSDYKGTISRTDTGKKCLNWKELQKKLKQQSSGIWTPNHPFCRNPNHDPKGVWCWVADHDREYCSYIQPCEKLCPSPHIPFRGHILHSTFSQAGAGYANASKVTFACDHGYRQDESDLNREYHLICVNARWVGVVPACRLIRCQVPSVGVTNAELDEEETEIAFHNSIKYECTAGHLFTNVKESIELTCIGNETWRADHLPIENYYLDVNKLEKEDIQKFSCVAPCNSGFDPVSDWCVKAVAKCPFGSATAPPDVPSTPGGGQRCAMKARFTCPPPDDTIEDGYRVGSKKGNKKESFMFGMTVSYVCDRGFRFIDGDLSKEISCLKSAMWDKSPQAFICVAYQCSRPLDPVYARPLGIPKGVKLVKTQTVVTVTCRAGYFVQPGIKSLVSTCDLDGVWRPPLGRCFPVNCGEPPYIRNTTVIGIGFALGSEILYKCEFGMHFEEDDGTVFWKSAHTCSVAGEWFPAPLRLKCVTTTCPAVNNVKRSFGENVGRTITIACENGDSLYMLGSPLPAKEITSKCGPFGKWVPSVTKLTCGPTNCPAPGKVPNANFISWVTVDGEEDEGPPYMGARAKYRCVNGSKSNPHFKIVNFVHEKRPCLAKSPELDSIQTLDFESCMGNSTSNVFWRWWKEDNRHLQHVASGLCLTSMIPYYVLQRKGYPFSHGSPKVSLLLCKAADKRQKWECGTRNETHFFIALKEEKPGTKRTVLRYDAYHETVTASNMMVEGTTHWSTLWGDELCSKRELKMNLTIICARDGSWIPSPTEAQCTTSLCTVPKGRRDLVFHGHAVFHNPANKGNHILGYGEVMLVTCADGYRTSPVDNPPTVYAKCENLGVWVPSIDQIRCVPTSCTPLDNIPNVFMSSGTKGWSYMTEIKLTCKTGMWFENIKQSWQMVSCGRDGAWSLPPALIKCSPVYCPETYPMPSHAKLVSTFDKFSFKSSFVLRCDKGRWFSRAQQEIILRCSENGIWLPQDLKCVRVTCQSPPRYIRFAELGRVNKGDVPVGAKVEYKCLDQRAVKNSNSFHVSCGFDGHWNPDPVNTTCRFPGCTPLDKLKNTIRNMEIEGTSNGLGSTIKIMCRAGHQMASGLSVKTTRCYEDRKWFPPAIALHCRSTVCETPVAVKNATLYGHRGASFGDSALLKCDEGHILASVGMASMEVHCNIGGKWNPDTSTVQCVVSKCPFPPASTLYDFKIPTKGKTEGAVGLVAVLTCIKGYFVKGSVNQVNVTCSSTGQWDPDPKSSICHPAGCPDPTPLKHSLQRIVRKGGGSGEYESQVSNITSGMKVEYKCEEHFTLSPGNTKQVLTCGADGKYDIKPKHLKKCLAMECPDLPEVPKTKIVNIKEGKFGPHTVVTKATYQCNSGMEFEDLDSNSVNVTCNEKERWDPDTTKLACGPKLCPKISPSYVVDSNSRDFRSEVKISCKPGQTRLFSVEQFLKVTCSGLGSWKPEIPEKLCSPISCGTPPSINSSSMKQETGDSHGDTATYTCSDGYAVRKGQQSWKVTCTKSGKWEPLGQQCVPVSGFECDAPPVVDHAKVDLPPLYTEGMLATYTCDDEYWMAGNRTKQPVTCKGGSWNPSAKKVNCHPVSCSRTNVYVHGATQLTKNAAHIGVGDKIGYACKPGNWVKDHGTSIDFVCTANGNWKPSNTKRKCGKLPCKALPVIKNGKYTTYMNTLNKIEAKYTCDTGYIFTSAKSTKTEHFTTACSDNVWKPDPGGRTCDILKCDDLPSMPNVILSFYAPKYNHTVPLRCNTGYKWVHGGASVKVRCDETANWDPNPKFFTCTEVDCGPPIDIEGADVEYTETEYKHEATYTCKDGKIVAGGSETSVTVTCKSLQDACGGLKIVFDTKRNAISYCAFSSFPPCSKL